MSGYATLGGEIDLSPYFTNLDSNIFGLKLPQEVAGALFSRYSRSEKTLREIFASEFLRYVDHDISPRTETLEFSVEKARRFYDRVLGKYGDDSIAQLGGAHIACEDISGLAALFLTDFRIGVGLIEKSTRYVRFDRKNDQGKYPYYIPPQLLNHTKYLETMDMLFAVYAKSIDPVIEKLKSLHPLSSIVIRHPETGEERYGHHWEGEWVKGAYASAIRSYALDILRCYLPISTFTNVGIFAVGQEWEHIVTSGYSHSLDEIRTLAARVDDELNKIIPSFVRRAAPNSYIVRTREGFRSFLKDVLVPNVQTTPPVPLDDVHLRHFGQKNELQVIQAILYSVGYHTGEVHPRFDSEILKAYVGNRLHRRDKPGRALEHAEYTFYLTANLGIYRDLKRHRILTQERQTLSVKNGFDTPEEIENEIFGIEARDLYMRIMGRLQYLHRDIQAAYGEEVAQYCIPMAYRQQWYMKVNLRELLHICELRTTPAGHPSYRKIAQKMWQQVIAINPLFANIPHFVDSNEYRLGRLVSELKHEQKKSSWRSINVG